MAESDRSIVYYRSNREPEPVNGVNTVLEEPLAAPIILVVGLCGIWAFVIWARKPTKLLLLLWLILFSLASGAFFLRCMLITYFNDLGIQN